MSRALFYVDELPAVGELVVLDGDEGFHAASVRRIRVAEELDFGDGSGTVAHVVVEHVAKSRLTARVTGVRTVVRPTPAVTVVQALPKSDRSELAIELATEAGADTFMAWQSDRCVARWDGAAKVQKGLRRWEAVARSAAMQSRRPHIPTVAALVSTRELAAHTRAVVDGCRSMALILHESATEPLAGLRLDTAEALMLIIGPEGGIGDDELALLTDAGALAIRLGPSVLRTSTAAAVALGALGVLTPRWQLEV
jgi:16S rRNA (uracil1498-N3)-methyltransferase